MLIGTRPMVSAYPMQCSSFGIDAQPLGIFCRASHQQVQCHGYVVGGTHQSHQQVYFFTHAAGFLNARRSKSTLALWGSLVLCAADKSLRSWYENEWPVSSFTASVFRLNRPRLGVSFTHLTLCCNEYEYEGLHGSFRKSLH